MKKDIKKRLREMTGNDLNIELEELNKQKRKLELDMLRKNGTSMLIRNYPTNKQTSPYGNIRNIKKSIAFVRTLIKNA